MNNWQKVFIVLLIIGALIYIKFALFSAPKPIKPPVSEQIQEEEQEVQKDEVSKEYVNVFFILVNQNKEEVYRAVKREYRAEVDGSKLKFAISSLIMGPNIKETSKGVYSEIPAGTRMISFDESPEKIIINLTSDFETGGGTESLYKRLYQLIKTANVNTKTPVYLYINGKQADVIGGEGIMITQPLNENSLHE